MLNKGNEYKQHIQKLKKQQLEEEMVECTFKVSRQNASIITDIAKY